ncbi:WxL protein host-binding domain-containing protein, partial [Enterococcus faecalis]
LPIYFGKEDLRPGTYIFEGKAVLKEDEQQVWPFKQEFTISSQEAKKLNKEAVVKLVLPTWWNQAFYGLLAATIVSLILAIWRFTQQKAILKQQAYLQQEKQAALKNRQGVRDDDSEK